jgi:large conductance mechanosensitive channel
MLKEFKEFAIKGNAIDLAVGIIIGAAFTSVVNSLVKDVIMPPIGALVSSDDFVNMHWVLDGSGPYKTVADAAADGAITLNYGQFINTITNFLLVAFVVFLLVKAINKLRRPAAVEVTTKECPYCLREIALQATRCPECTSDLGAGQPG